MTAIQPPLYIAVNGAYGPAHLGLPYRDILGEGVVGTTDLAVAQRGAGANMSVDVAAGAAWVKGDDDVDTQPLYRVRNDATINLAILGADASKPRIDRIVARVYDSSFAGTALTWAVEVIAGTPTTAATLTNLNGAAAVPNTALLLANVLVPATATTVVTADIGDVRPFAAVGGGSAQLAGGEIAYDARNSNVNVTGTTSGAATSIIAGSSHTYDGSPVMVEFFAPQCKAESASPGTLQFGLYDNGTLIATIADITVTTQDYIGQVVGKMRVTPSAGPHTYSVQAWAGSTTGTPRVSAGNGAGGNDAPAYLRITKA